MQFKPGDEVDSDHCRVLRHEFFRCNDSFKQFCFFAEQMIINGKSRERSYRAYNAYADFIHHLYEFMIGCQARDTGNTKITNKKDDHRVKMIEGYITHHAQRVMDNYREAINSGAAPSWVNDVSYYDVKVPPEFAKDFREYRNKVCGHVAYERSSKLSLTEFYQKYHKYLFYLYHDALYWWGRRNKEFPDLKEITEFSLMLKKKNAN